jgi:hypothetical protein
MKKMTLSLLILIAFISIAAYTLYPLSRDTGKNAEPIQLKFVVMPQERLTQLPFESDWMLLDNRPVANISGFAEILVNMYVSTENTATLILQDRNGFYDMQMTLEGDPDNVTVAAEDLTGNGANEMVVYINKGTTYQEVKIFAYNGEEWVALLATDNLIQIDLDSDGTNELVSTSMGSLPGYVKIYRWQNDSFEQADVADNTDSEFAIILQENDELVIEAGKPYNIRRFTYKNGSLNEKG